MKACVHLVNVSAGPRWAELLHTVQADDVVILLDLRGLDQHSPLPVRCCAPASAIAADQAPVWCALIDDQSWAELLTGERPVLCWT